jgi:hypothetical protein
MNTATMSTTQNMAEDTLQSIFASGATFFPKLAPNLVIAIEANARIDYDHEHQFIEHEHDLLETTTNLLHQNF